MKPALQCLTFVVASIAAAVGALAQEPAFPIGNWQSAASETITWALHPALTGGEFYLKIDVSNDGSFRGEWGELFCSGGSPCIFSCRLSGKSERVSGRFGPGGDGVIDLGQLGRSAFKWSVARGQRTDDRSAEDLAGQRRDSLSGAHDARRQGQTHDGDSTGR